MLQSLNRNQQITFAVLILNEIELPDWQMSRFLINKLPLAAHLKSQPLD